MTSSLLGGDRCYRDAILLGSRVQRFTVNREILPVNRVPRFTVNREALPSPFSPVISSISPVISSIPSISSIFYKISSISHMLHLEICTQTLEISQLLLLKPCSLLLYWHYTIWYYILCIGSWWVVHGEGGFILFEKT